MVVWGGGRNFILYISLLGKGGIGSGALILNFRISNFIYFYFFYNKKQRNETGGAERDD